MSQKSLEQARKLVEDLGAPHGKVIAHILPASEQTALIILADKREKLGVNVEVLLADDETPYEPGDIVAIGQYAGTRCEIAPGCDVIVFEPDDVLIEQRRTTDRRKNEEREAERLANEDLGSKS